METDKVFSRREIYKMSTELFTIVPPITWIRLLDLYYSKNIGKKDELSLNLVGSHYDTNSTQFDREWILNSNQDVFNNDMILKAKQNGIVAEVAHSHSFEKEKLNSGYRISNNSISNDLQNLAGNSNYTVNYLQQYLYTEIFREER